MKSITIVGGKLQGTEACYLGKKAGIKIILIDKDPDAPAKNLCDDFVCGDVLNLSDEVTTALTSADMVLPTIENDEVLEALAALSEKLKFIYAFDLQSYKTSKSKKLSDKLFHDNGVSAPQYYPKGFAPYIAKPDSASGSHGVVYLRTREEADLCAKETPDAVIQEFIEGSSYSIEIIGRPGNYRTYEITEIYMDEIYDCKMVTSPCDISDELKESFAHEAVRIAEIMKLEGIMDYEVIDSGKNIAMLEIDARLPSQTPTVVYKASGMNMIEELYDLFVTGDFKTAYKSATKHAVLEHYIIEGKNIKAEGEHIMTAGKSLRYAEGFCESQEAITDCRFYASYDEVPNSDDIDAQNEQESIRNKTGDSWRVTFINSDETIAGLDKKRNEVMECLKNIL